MPTQKRRKVSLWFLIALGIGIGLFIKSVKIGLIIGLILGIVATGLSFGGNKK
jgi:hypothetical protein